MNASLYSTSAVPPPPPAPARMGLAIASLVLGAAALFFSFFLIGLLIGLVGLILGSSHLTRKRGKNWIAWCGIGLSVLSICISIAMGVFYVRILEGLSTSSKRSLTRWEGSVAPDLAVQTLDGRRVQLSDLKGRRVILDFWATWCGPCVMEVPHFIRLHREMARGDLEIIGISQEKPETLKNFITAKGVSYTVARPIRLPSPYRDIRAIPTTFFIDRRGVIQKVVVGAQAFQTLKALALAEDFQGTPRLGPAPPVTAAETSSR